MTKISVIIPVYNMGQYLRRCLDSLLCQNYKDAEILLIDDGSKDDSPQICDEYAEKDKRVKVFHQKNAGVSAARNKALDNATGEYITCVDPDDYVPVNYFATIDSLIKQCDCDWYIASFNKLYPSGYLAFENTKAPDGYSDDKKFLLNESVNFRLYIDALWNKVYKREIIEKNKIRFNAKLKICEDKLFNLQYLDAIKDYRIDNIILYIYFQNTVSARFNRKLVYVENDDFVLAEIMKRIEKCDDKETLKNSIYEIYLSRLFLNLDNYRGQKIKGKELRKLFAESKNYQLLSKYKFKTYSLNLQKRIIKAYVRNCKLGYVVLTMHRGFLRFCKRVLSFIKRIFKNLLGKK